LDTNLLEKESDTGEVYVTNNFLLKILNRRFVRKIKFMLNDFGAYNLQGVDIGSAEGQLLSLLIAGGEIDKICSIELEFEKIQSSILQNKNIQFVQADAQCLCCKDNSFDFVMATEILEHLPEPEKALAEIYRIAKPNAPIVISVPFEPFFHYGNLIRGKHFSRGGKTPSHLHFWHKKEFSNLLCRYLNIKESYSIATFPWLVYYCFNK
jgi:2-polyprenyl-3-methyl-5-hydroxy-6-metoxy-1,4-benzoquinol methylase